MPNEFEEEYNIDDFNDENIIEDVDNALSEKNNKETDSEPTISTGGFSKKEKTPAFVKEYEKIGLNEEFPEEGMVLTIDRCAPQKVKESDKPKITNKESDFGYFKKKLIVYFKESRKIMFEGKEEELKFIEYLPSIFYTYSKGEVKDPTIPKACSDEHLKNNFKPTTAKVRNKFLKANPEIDVKQSDYDFVESLKDKKVFVKKEVFDYQDQDTKEDKKGARLVFEKFV